MVENVTKILKLVVLIVCMAFLIFSSNVKIFALSPNDFTILEAQIGYKPEEEKMAFIFSQNPTSDSLGTFELKNAANNNVVFTSNITYWGEKWGQCFWVLNFSDYKMEGSYYINVPSLSKQSGVFKIQNNIFTTETLIKTSVDQLEQRIGGKMGWQDCGSDLRAVEGHATQLYGLQDAYNTYKDVISQTDRDRFIQQIKHGSDYLLACQQANGSFCSEYYVAPDKIRWHLTILATTALARTYAITNEAQYLAASVNGWNWCMGRPSFTADEINGEIKDTRMIYGQYSPWLPPQELRARDKLMIIWAGTELYRITSNNSYKNTAITYANDIYDQQFLDYTKTIEGLYGNFYAWSGLDIFQKSWEHGGWDYDCGAVLPDHIVGLINLVEMFPTETDWLKWRYILKVYVEDYLKKTKDLNPFQIYPLGGMYPNEIRYFGPSWHGGNGIYGNIAKNSMLLARMFDDLTFEKIADHNMQWVGGLNFGKLIDGQRQSISMIVGVGVHYAGSWTGIQGSICNGFASTNQFTLAHPDTLFDAPLTFTDEEWIVHNGGWLSGLSEVEKAMILNIRTKYRGAGVPANIVINLPETYSYSTNANGELTVDSLPVLREGTIQATYQGRTIAKSLKTIAGYNKTVIIDFSDCLSLTIDANASTKQGTVSVTNFGSEITNIAVSLKAIGINLSTNTFSGPLTSGSTNNYNFTFDDSDFSKVQPFLIYATVQGNYSNDTAETLGELPVTAIPHSFSNHDFETGDLTNWTVVNGTAFGNGSVTNLNTAAGGSNEYFNKQRDYVLWGYKLYGDGAVGELRSNSFTVGSGIARLKVGGGNDINNLYVALVDASNNQVLVKETGRNSETLRWVTWDVNQYAGKQCYIKAYDNSTGAWGHINVDDLNIPIYVSGFETNLKNFTPIGNTGTWTMESDGLRGTISDGAYMSGVTGNNFIYEANIKLDTAQAAALVFRSTANPYTGGGYFVNIDKTEGLVKLFKLPYSLIASAPRTIDTNTTYHLKVITKNSNIKVYFNDETAPCINANDTTYSSGYFGVNVYNGGTSGTAKFNFLLKSPSSGFETNLTSFTAVGTNESWTEGTDGLVGEASDGAYMSNVIGNNFSYEADVRLDTTQAAALVFRSAANPYTNGGYFVNVDRVEGLVKLFKVGPYSLIASANRTINLGTVYHLKVVTNNSNIQVYFNNESTPCINVNDIAYSSGYFGVSVYKGTTIGIATFNYLFKN